MSRTKIFKLWLISGVILCFFTAPSFADTEPNDTAGTAEEITVGTYTGSVQDTISNPNLDASDFYIISVKPSQWLHVIVTAHNDLADDYEQVAAKIFSSEDLQEQDERSSIGDGESYTLRWGRSFESTGSSCTIWIGGAWNSSAGDPSWTVSYTLEISTYTQNDAGSGADAPATLANAISISTGTTHSCKLYYEDEKDMYKVQLPSGAQIKIECQTLNNDIENAEWVNFYLYTEHDSVERADTFSNDGEWKTMTWNNSLDYTVTCLIEARRGLSWPPYETEYNLKITILQPTPTISLSKTSLSFSAVSGGSNPSNQTFTVTNTGETDSTLNWSGSDDMSWLTLSPTSGALSKDGSETVTASVNISGLSTGTYTGTITVSDSNASNSPRTISVSLTVSVTGGGAEEEVVTLQNNVLNFATNSSAQVDISFVMTQSGNVTIKIYTLDGALVKTLVDENKSAGTVSEQWNGKVKTNIVPSGIYYLRIEAPGITETKKICIVK